MPLGVKEFDLMRNGCAVSSSVIQIKHQMSRKFVFLPRILIVFMAISVPVLGSDLKSVETREPLVALTFDDGPNGENMEQILSILAEENATATFFLVGKNIEEQVELARKTLSAGHELANHSMTHPHLPQLESREEIEQQIVETQALIEKTAGVTPVCFRAPFGEYDERVEKVLEASGLRLIGASRSARDWETDVTAETIIARTVDGIHAGDIVVLHSWSTKTAEALPEIFTALKVRGLRCVTVSELLASAQTKEG